MLVLSRNLSRIAKTLSLVKQAVFIRSHLTSKN